MGFAGLPRRAVVVVALGLFCLVASASELSFMLDDDHETYRWRTLAGRPDPDIRKVVIWTRHKGIGIGNALGGFARIMQDALMEDRVIVIRSIILRKFCEILSCAMHPVEG